MCVMSRVRRLICTGLLQKLKMTKIANILSACSIHGNSAAESVVSSLSKMMFVLQPVDQNIKGGFSG
jgi:hypothetical protein